jgi:glyoxylase-like metal-dependent hydrolase (beta-lactamase superfamily II)
VIGVREFIGCTVGRRSFLVGAGRGVLGVAVLGLAGCSCDDGSADVGGSAQSGSAGGLAWSRVDLAYVSAYVLVRGGEAVVVDTGVGGSADRIGATLDAAGSGWDGVRAVVVTHAHYDHFGSLGDVADRAPGSPLYAGASDLEFIRTPPAPPPGGAPAPHASYGPRLRAVGDGDEVLGLQVVATPGHTPGHVAVFDPDSAVLVAGDALTNTIDGVLSGPLPEATADHAAAADSVRKLARLRPQVILVGHGPPLERSAAGKLRRLARSQS